MRNQENQYGDWQPTPLNEILDEIHNPDPEPDYMQFYQPLGALLGEAEPNKLPTQDWEYDLINHQVAGNLEQPAYKNLTPEIIQSAAEKGAPAGSQTDAAPTDGQGAASAPPASAPPVPIASAPETLASSGPLVRAAQSHVQQQQRPPVSSINPRQSPHKR